MGKKRKLAVTDHETYEEDRAPAEYSNPHKQQAGGSRVEPETVSYLQEVSQHFSGLRDAEEKELLLANVLEEIQGKEGRIASDAVTSRLLEHLLVGAPAPQLMRFMQAFTNEDLMFSLAGRCACSSKTARGNFSCASAAAADTPSSQVYHYSQVMLQRTRFNPRLSSLDLLYPQCVWQSCS